MPTVETNGIETYFERHGTGPPVVFVHGATLDHSQWDPQVDALTDEFTTITYDVRGHGETGGSDLDDYSVPLFADDLADLVDALDLDGPVVCGLSLGGCIAQVFADQYPDRLSGLVLADTFTPKPLSQSERVQRSLLRATIPFARLLGYERVERAIVRLQQRHHGEDGADADSQIEAIRERGSSMPTDEFAKVMRAIARFDRVTVDYDSITVPALILYGETEPPFLREQAWQLLREIPTASLKTVPDAGHTSNLDNPEFVTDAIREFLPTVFGEQDET